MEEIERMPHRLLLRVRTGSFGNCGGKAELRLSVEPVRESELLARAPELPAWLSTAALQGAREELERQGGSLRLILWGGRDHPTDATPRAFALAGRLAVRHALAVFAPTSPRSP